MDKEDTTRMYRVLEKAVERTMAQWKTKNFIPWIDRDDFVQECILGWLEGIYYKNVMVRIIRRHSPHKRTQGFNTETLDCSVEFNERIHGITEDADTTLEVAELWDAIAELPKDERFVMECYYGYGLSVREIARLLNLGTKNKTKVARWKKAGEDKLRRKLRR